MQTIIPKFVDNQVASVKNEFSVGLIVRLVTCRYHFANYSRNICHSLGSSVCSVLSLVGARSSCD